MHPYIIDYLLEKFTPDQIEKYDKRNLGDSKLKEVNREYKSNKKPTAIIYHWIKTGVIYSFILDTGWLISMFCGGLSDISNYLFFGLLIAIFLWIVFAMDREVSKSKEIESRCSPILQDFQLKEGELNPLSTKVDIYTEDIICAILVSLAMRVRLNENNYDIVSKMGSSMVEDAIYQGKILISSQERLSTAIEAAKHFGSNFEKQKIIALAKESNFRQNSQR